METFFRMTLCRGLACALAAVAALEASPVKADWMLLGGAEEVFDGRFAQVTALFPFSGQLGNGFVHRYSVSYIGYEYPVEDDVVEADSWGGSVAIGYQIPVPNGWLGFGAGAAYRNTHYTPSQPDNPQEGSSIVAQVDIDAGLLHANRLLYATSISYTPRYRAYWGRARVLVRTSPRTLLGPEFVAHGDRDYDARQFGLALQLNRVVGPLELVIKAGTKRIRDGESGAYGGVEFLRHFN
ncbi:hypothetical protein J2T57_003828 [Natronocella acetinitrilica]|uniref:Cellulose biosynthesis protein BcsS n=1 Tax=Natronocella acetinitrilica TaxID=414046 RepID=A0AAE3KHS9_9GAMM|nr:cellulose biosynthesis protein BcsS [Natronocella acetinitrilica]MCP1676657.1 hypothetical protein [Natronocella acetinitrilica]